MKMKKYFLLALVLLTGITTSCKYDDGEIWDSVNNLADRVSALETLTKQMNSDITALQTVVAAFQNQVTISKVEELTDGYIIHFSDGTKATIRNGKNGTDGKAAPVVGVAQENGIYYWTMTVGDKTQWLTDDDGNKMRVTIQGTSGAAGVQGQNGVTPKVKAVQEGDHFYWKVSYDNGGTWDYVKDENGNKVDAKGEKGKDAESPLKVTSNADGTVSFTMNDDETYTFSLAAAVTYSGTGYDSTKDVQTLTASATMELTYQVANLTSCSIEVLKQENVTVVLAGDKIKITAGTAGTGKVIILFYNDHQTITSVLNFNITN